MLLTRYNDVTLFVLVVQAVRQVLQALEHAVDTPADPFGHATLPLPILWQTLPPEVGHEEAYVHTHRSVLFSYFNSHFNSGVTKMRPIHGSRQKPA